MYLSCPSRRSDIFCNVEPYEVVDCDTGMVKFKDEKAAGHKINSDTNPENMYDTVGLHHDYKVSTCIAGPDLDNVYDEIELHDVNAAEDIYEEVGVANNISMEKNVCYSSTLQ